VSRETRWQPEDYVAPVTDWDHLREVVANLVTVERDRVLLLGLRDELVAELRTQGASWAACAVVTGTSPEALMKRG